MRRLFLLLLAAALLGCPDASPPEKPPEPVDAAHAGVEAGPVDAGPLADAGTAAPDAGVDAGSHEDVALEPLSPVRRPTKSIKPPRTRAEAKAAPTKPDRKAELAVQLSKVEAQLAKCGEQKPPASDRCACGLVCAMRFSSTGEAGTVEHGKVGPFAYEVDVRADGRPERCTLVLGSTTRSLRCPE